MLKDFFFLILTRKLFFLFLLIGEVHQKTEWHRICVFKPHLRETAYNYAAKGNRVMVQGRLLYGEVTDSNGTTQNTVSIVADDIIYFKNAWVL